MPADKNIKIVQDVFLLYELSLALGGALDPLENSRKFLNVLVGRKQLTYAAVWLRERTGEPARLYYAHPARDLLQTEISADHYVWRQLDQRSFFTVTDADPHFREMVQETHVVRGAYAIFSLGELGFLKLFSAGSTEALSKLEMSQLETVVHKFKVSLEGCLAHGRLMEESERRLKVQQELERSNERFIDLFENMSDALVIFDAEGNILEANKAAKELARIDELPSPNFWHIVPPDEVENIRAAFHSVLEHGEKRELELRIVIPGGQTKYIQVNSSGIFKNGRLIGTRNIVRDITRQKETEEAIRSNQVRIRELIRNLQAGVLFENEKREILLTNQFFCDIFGIPAPPSALIGLDCSGAAEQAKDLFVDPRAFMDGVETLLKNQELVVGQELRMVDGRILERDFIPLRSDGKYLGHFWQYRDVTEKRKVAEAIRKSEEKYRGIIENMELGLLEVDAQGRVVRAYDRFCQMTGYAASELIGKDAALILIPEDQRHIMEKQSADRRKGKAGIYEIQLRKKDGALMWTIISGAPLMNAEGELTGSLGIHYDITKRKELEWELAEANHKAKQARLAEQQFLANMSHEIRTPMNAVIGMTHLLYETPINDQQREYLDALRFSADTLLGIIDNILDLSKIEAGELEIEEKTFNLLELTQLIQRTFQFKLRDKPVSVTLDFDHRIHHLVVADPTRLNQILTNLMSNASKFTHAGTIGLRVLLQDLQADRYRIRFEVHDTGIGIPADKIQMIFQNFKQADIKVTRKFGGTGLGLAIVKQLVELMKGTIEVQSEESLGSTFSVELTLGKSNTRIAGEKTPRDQIGSEEKVFLQKINVLVVEDNTMNQKLIANILKTWGCAYDLAVDAQAALQQTQAARYDLILMDVHMPGMDGCEATSRIRSDERNPNRQSLIIALTAAALLDEKKRALAAGMDEYLTKPFSPAQLRRLVLRKMNFSSSSADVTEDSPVEPKRVSADLNYLYEISGEDPFFVRDMLETFLEETPEALRRMMTELNCRQWEDLYRTVHSLKPNLMMLGMKTQEELAAHIEKLLKSENYEESRLYLLLARLDQETRAALPVLNDLLEAL